MVSRAMEIDRKIVGPDIWRGDGERIIFQTHVAAPNETFIHSHPSVLPGTFHSIG
jgi:hypothetical protein